MEWNTNHLRVKDLKALAKQRGLKGYSQLKKAEFVPLLMSTPIMDDPVPNIRQDLLILQPTKRTVLTKGSFHANSTRFLRIFTDPSQIFSRL